MIRQDRFFFAPRFIRGVSFCDQTPYMQGNPCDWTLP